MDQERINVNVNTQETSERERFSSLISGLLEDLQGLVRDEIRLAKAELREDMQTVMRAVAMIAAAAIFALVGLIILLMGVSILLSETVRTWLAFAIVGLAALVLAALLGIIGKNRLSAGNLKPEQTIESMKENKEWANQQIKSVKN
jgi:uncharacterized membrane protein YqjE